ncbi:L-proline dehydrogenase /delta-1-pyrroline-5-carboxylate dehydrogenase [Tistlia consotensis]|uniref:Bifunctional protein PutA n=1 Tax=Tistlia consotensis USBA 355 TaxID=560819 RepID=A0A1Y6CNL1_9PROT|nr:bifunctional proline dehydrogenase/L-glutamate gamma-semialdehyde dehydrogenase PutA [Tistlia consotensis]SMF76967.1 L-proline dehydrogenase /delta-1-pyrroline-5-carboxylate dehydrogenase [Tistlia consotensis USBA 355]SNS13617.1 L-proline dehydrogenase /delta-1-pyrroline-5-carboxylate dehydrogenase [Tistlia consotensis]
MPLDSADPADPQPSDPLVAARARVRRLYLADEAACVADLAASLGLDRGQRDRIVEGAAGLVAEIRDDQRPGMLEAFLAEYGLSTKEGIALMCLAEALLRVPDAETMDELIEDKIAPGEWDRHVGRSGSALVNASAWGLMLTGKILDEEASRQELTGVLRRLVKRLSEPVVRSAVLQAMKILGRQFVLGETIEEALERGRPLLSKGYSFSFDMLGEAARTAADARRYFRSYAAAIAAIGEASSGDDVRANPGISVKLSALHPRYEFTKPARVMDELVPRVAALCQLARNAGIGLNIDAEEAERLDISLAVIEAVAASPDLKDWPGFGIVVQAYQKRAPAVIDWLDALARKHGRRFMVRLVKGAYWDSEVKLAQVQGLAGYPVFTRKAATDVSYLACARRLLDASERLYPQFATHNAHTVQAVLEMGGTKAEGRDFEFQRLHGMGEALHERVVARSGRICRIYAPVGEHRDLLAYLVRRLLENGANSSFVHRILDAKVPPREVVPDPLDLLERQGGVPNRSIPAPPALYGDGRKNARGWNLADPDALAALEGAMAPFRRHRWLGRPLVAGRPLAKGAEDEGAERLNPADHGDGVGRVIDADAASVEAALAAAGQGFADWSRRTPAERATVLREVAELYEDNAPELMALATREAGKSRFDAIAEIREAVDFLRYYANETERVCGEAGGGPGLKARGAFVCISPWNFPLAIFTGQIAAALGAGNAVLAKPAEQTPLIATRAAELMHEAGVPLAALQLLPGDGATVGGALVADPRTAGVCFTGSTATAQAIHRALAAAGKAEAPLIAETGGLNCMIVDSTALPEQAVRDILASGFQSAGQRCSALRMLCLQEDVAETVLTMLKGAMAELALGDPWALSVDVGPVIDAEARADIEGHCAALEAQGRLVARTPLPPEVAARGTFVAPGVYRLDGIEQLEREVFGPVVHVATYRAEELESLVERINARGYGLTLGVHSRIEDRVEAIVGRAHVGNLYVNRNQIGAVVGVQPFGGEGLSGTGPKAGGPFYLRRFLVRDGDAAAPAPAAAAGEAAGAPQPWPELTAALAATLADHGAWRHLADRIERLRRAAGLALEGEPLLQGRSLPAALRGALEDCEPLVGWIAELPGPTGERNTLRLASRGPLAVLLSAEGEPAEAWALAARALAFGNPTLLVLPEAEAGPARRFAEALAGKGRSPLAVVGLPDEASALAVAALPGLTALAVAGPRDLAVALRRVAAQRPGAILPLIHPGDEPTRFAVERCVSVDITASGGNAALLANAEG